MKTHEEKQNTFSDQGIQNMAVFSVVLKRIHVRLVSEGYTIGQNKELIAPMDLVKPLSNACVKKNDHEKSRR